MIKVFDGEWRGLGKNSKQKGAIIGFEFRNYLHYFKGATLHVFMSISLHVDREGYCYPSYDTIQKETGYGRGTVAKAIAELCDMVIEGHRVLMKWRERGDDGKFTGSNRYRIFPTPEEIAELDIQSSVSSTVDSQSSENPTVENSNCGKSELEDKPVSKDKPIDKEIVADEQQPTKHVGKKPRKRKPTAYVNPETNVSTTDILQAYEEALKHAEPGAIMSYGKESKAAKLLAEAGWRPSDITTCFWKMKKEEYWQNKNLSLASVASQIGAIVGKGKTRPPARANGNDKPYKGMQVLA